MIESMTDDAGQGYSLARLNRQTGYLEDPLVNLRVMIVDAEFYKALRDKLYARFQSGASVILYEMGSGYGELMAKSIHEMGAGKIEIYRKFIERGKRLGYGEFKVPVLQSILAGLKGEARVILKDSFFAAASGRTGHVECWLIAGMIAGAARKIMDRDMDCVEVLCASKGDPRCEFTLKGSG